MRLADREEVARQFARVRDATESLAEGLAPEDQVVQSMPDVSPTKWHRAHTTWFFETFVLAPFAGNYTPFDPHFSYLFNSYYEAVGPRHARPERGLLSRPTAAEVGVYRRHVDAAVRQFIESPAPALWPQAAERIELGLHHEQQHQELLLMDIKHVFSCHPFPPTFRPRRGAAGSTEAAPLRWFEHEGGLFEIGHAGDGFAFDNEGPRHKVWLQPFRLASRPVTAGEVLDFIADDGYRRAGLWLSDGWALCRQEEWEAPLYWRRERGSWQIFTLHGLEPVDPTAPACHLSYYEADAIANWAGKRLPTEAEWEVVARELPIEGHLFDGEHLHPRASADGERPVALFGDVWEWTRSAYAPYPGYRPPVGPTSEYNGKFMSNQMVLRGGCVATPPDHIRFTYRNFFYPHTRWHFGGARLAEDAG